MPRGDKKKKGPTYDSKELEKGRNLYEEMENTLISMNAQGTKFTQFQKKMVSNYAAVAKEAHKSYKTGQMNTKEFQSRFSNNVSNDFNLVKIKASESDVNQHQNYLNSLKIDRGNN